MDLALTCVAIIYYIVISLLPLAPPANQIRLTCVGQFQVTVAPPVWVSVFAIIINQEFDLCHVTNFSNECELFEIIYDRKTLTKCVAHEVRFGFVLAWGLGSGIWDLEPRVSPQISYRHNNNVWNTKYKKKKHQTPMPNNGFLVGNFYYL